MTTRPIILDADNYAMRGIMASAMDDLKAKGAITGGIYAACNSLPLILAREKYWPRIACWDTTPPPWRLKLCPEYKANRKAQWDEKTYKKVVSQKDAIADMLALAGFVNVAYEQREADDVIAAFCRVWYGHTPMVVSSDKDLLQVVGLGAEVYQLGKATVVTRANFDKVTGVPPGAYLVYRAMVGDTSDGIKGVQGVGPKTASTLIDACMSHTFLASPPEQQIMVLAEEVQRQADSRPKKTKWQDVFLTEGVDTVLRNLRIMDLTLSFGKLDPLRVVATKAQSAKVDGKGLYGFLHEYKFATLMDKWSQIHTAIRRTQ